MPEVGLERSGVSRTCKTAVLETICSHRRSTSSAGVFILRESVLRPFHTSGPGCLDMSAGAYVSTCPH